MENTLRVMTPEETKVTRKNSGPSFSSVTNVTNIMKGKSMINQPFHDLKYETKVTGFFLVHVEISVTKITNGKYTESDDSKRNKSNKKKFWAIFSLVTNVTNVMKGKSMINHLFQYLKYETKVTGFFLVHFEISVTKVTYIESDDSKRNKMNEKKFGPSFPPVTNLMKGKSMINQPFQHLQY